MHLINAALILLLALLTYVSNAGQALYLKAGTIKNAADIGLFGGVDRPYTGKYFLVQFREKIGSEQVQALTSFGVQIVRYVPDHGYLIRTEKKTLAQLQSKVKSIRLILPYLPQFRVSPELQNRNADELVTVRIQLFSDIDFSLLLAQMHQQIKFTLLGQQLRALSLQTTYQFVSQLAAFDGVEWIESERRTVSFAFEMSTVKSSPIGVRFSNPFLGSTRIPRFSNAWREGLTGEGQQIAMADTGLDSGEMASLHVDLADQVNKSYLVGLFAFSWADMIGHGTHLASLMVGLGSAAKATGFRSSSFGGGAPSAKLIVQSIWSPVSQSIEPPLDLGELFKPAYSDGARVHLDAWGTEKSLPAYDQRAMQVDDFVWTHPDFVIVAAMGNEGNDADSDGRVDAGSISSPATAKNCLAVGASENFILKGGIQSRVTDLESMREKFLVEPLRSDWLSDHSNGIAAFSSRGPTADGRRKPDVLAPGTNILGVRSKASDNNLWGKFDGNYVFFGGTSVGAPIVAAAATLTRERLVRDLMVTLPSAALIKAMLMHSACDLFPGQFGLRTMGGQELLGNRPDVNQGFGRIDIARMIKINNSDSIIIDHPGLKTGEKVEFRIVAQKQIIATLVYSDSPSALTSSKNLVNDLDLEVINPKGQIDAPLDRINNSEIVEHEVALPGVHVVRVLGFDVPFGDDQMRQPFALIVTVDDEMPSCETFEKNSM